MIAMTVLVVGFLSITSLLSRSLGLNRVIANNYTATYLAAEGVEIVKNILDGNVKQVAQTWNEGFPCAPGNPCIARRYSVDYMTTGPMDKVHYIQGQKLSLDQNNLYNYLNGSQTPFERTVEITPIPIGHDTDEYEVRSTVDWISRGGNFTATVVDYFYNWRQSPQ